MQDISGWNGIACTCVEYPRQMHGHILRLPAICQLQVRAHMGYATFAETRLQLAHVS